MCKSVVATQGYDARGDEECRVGVTLDGGLLDVELRIKELAQQHILRTPREIRDAKRRYHER